MSDSKDLLAKISGSSTDNEYFLPLPKGYQKGKTKYVIVTGTVMSGLGKGIFSSCLAKLMQDKGLKVAPIKLEGYLNIDSGTLNPFRHGEVFVLDDGMETDMDLGTYERMLDQNLSRLNFATSGQIYSSVLNKERHGDYLGRDVQMIPHMWCSSRSAARWATWKMHSISRPCVNWLTKKVRTVAVLWP
jgi:CTP synthase